LAYSRADGLPILQIDILELPLSSTQIAELANRLHIGLADLVNQEYPSYTSYFEQLDFFRCRLV